MVYLLRVNSWFNRMNENFPIFPALPKKKRPWIFSRGVQDSNRYTMSRDNLSGAVPTTRISQIKSSRS